MKRKTPELNASSMADIAFLLLIFFLVTTTINTDSGINRKLPPMEDNTVKPPKVKERNVFIVLLNKNNELYVESAALSVSDLREKCKEFILNPTNSANLPEKKVKNIPLIGDFPVSKGLVSLKNDVGTRYEVYLQVQNELTAAFNEVRNDLARRKFNKTLDKLNEEQLKAIKTAIPMSISEAEPKKR